MTTKIPPSYMEMHDTLAKRNKPTCGNDVCDQPACQPGSKDPYGAVPGIIRPKYEGAAKMESARRKGMPLFQGCLQYFPDALLAVAEHSRKANDKHNPGEPLHWSKEKSKDHADCVGRHLIDIGPKWDAIDPEFGSYHAAALAWRALALLQTVIEREGK